MGGVARFALFLLVFSLLASFVFAEKTYHFQVRETGETEVNITADEVVEIVLPKDVTEPSVQDGMFTKTRTGIRVVPEGSAVINYGTSYYTSKKEGVWQFEANFIADKAVVVLPQAVHVVQSIPRATVTKEEAWQLEWANVTGSVFVQYVSVRQAAAAKQLPEQRTYWALLLWLAVIAAGVGIYYFAAKAPKAEKGLPKMSDGQLNVIRAANPNEALVLKLVLKNNGHIKRNALEHESGLSKSSLASSLKNLEKKNLIIVDRTFFVHHISLSQWFKDLK